MISLIEEALLLKITQACNNTLVELINADNISAKQLLKLDNKTIKLIIKYSPFGYLIRFTQGKILIESIRNPQVLLNSDLVITVSLVNILKIKLANIDTEQAVRANDIEFNGNLNLAIDLQKLLDKTEVNIKELLQSNLAEITSDLFAWQFIKLLDTVSIGIKTRKEEFKLQCTGYLQVEKGYLVSKIEVDDFCHSVDRVRDDLERLLSRVKAIE